MQCSVCGNQVNSGAQFCQTCGQNLSQSPALPPGRDAAQRAQGGAASSSPQPVSSQSTSSPAHNAGAAGHLASAEVPRPISPSARPPLASVAGIVRSFHSRVETPPVGPPSASLTVWTFRVEVMDATGNVVVRVPIEMRALSLRGAVHDGDTVEIQQAWKPGQTLHPRKLRNVTTQELVTVRDYRSVALLSCLGFVIAVIAILAVLFFAVPAIMFVK
jgi:hypothetical protein